MRSKSVQTSYLLLSQIITANMYKERFCRNTYTRMSSAAHRFLFFYRLDLILMVTVCTLGGYGRPTKHQSMLAFVAAVKWCDSTQAAYQRTTSHVMATLGCILSFYRPNSPKSSQGERERETLAALVGGRGKEKKGRNKNPPMMR